MKPVVFLNSHPIQYFVPLYQQIHAGTGIDLTVLYCSDESVTGKLDKGFGKEVKWDIPLLDGYKWQLIKNRSWKPSIHKGFWGLFNPGIISFLYKQPRSILIVHGWAYSTNLMALIFGRMFGHTVCLRTETPYNQELQKNRFITFFKHIYLRFLFLFVKKFLYIGNQNKLFYKALGIGENRMLFTPYAVDNRRFREILNSVTIENARRSIGLPVDKKIILFSGKYIQKKRPLDLLMAFNELGDKSDLLLVMLGEGECRHEMEIYIQKNDLTDKVVLTGFINQTRIPIYYRSADIFVMCSGLGETWGLSVNEAMNFGLPVIVSDTCGCAYDLVEESVTGAVFETGNIMQITGLLQNYFNKSVDEKAYMKQAVINRINGYSYENIIAAIKEIA